MYNHKRITYAHKILAKTISKPEIDELRYGFDLSESTVQSLVKLLEERLRMHSSSDDLRQEILTQRYSD